jgi:hypothetical protein
VYAGNLFRSLDLSFFQSNETEASHEGDEAGLVGQDGPKRTRGNFIEGSPQPLLVI